MTDDKLPRELVWEGSHLSEVGVTTLADGQEILLERDAIDHASGCEWCGGRLGRTALMAATVGEALASVSPAASSARHAMARATPAPWRALAMGLAVAVLAAAPSLPHLVSDLLGLLSYGEALTTHGVPVLVRGGVALAHSESVRRALTLATAASSALLVMMGWAIARSRSHVTVDRSMS